MLFFSAESHQVHLLSAEESARSGICKGWGFVGGFFCLSSFSSLPLTPAESSQQYSPHEPGVGPSAACGSEPAASAGGPRDPARKRRGSAQETQPSCYTSGVSRFSLSAMEVFISFYWKWEGERQSMATLASVQRTHTLQKGQCLKYEVQQCSSPRYESLSTPSLSAFPIRLSVIVARF